MRNEGKVVSAQAVFQILERSRGPEDHASALLAPRLHELKPVQLEHVVVTVRVVVGPNKSSAHRSCSVGFLGTWLPASTVYVETWSDHTFRTTVTLASWPLVVKGGDYQNDQTSPTGSDLVVDVHITSYIKDAEHKVPQSTKWLR